VRAINHDHQSLDEVIKTGIRLEKVEKRAGMQNKQSQVSKTCRLEQDMAISTKDIKHK